MLLTDVFEKFFNTCLEYYGLDPSNAFSSPGLTWNVMLKMTEIELELISDNEMYLFVENGMRVGISYNANYLVKPIINTCNLTVIKNQANLLCIRMQIIYMVGQ